MEPLYTPKNTTPAYQLNWGLTIFWRAAPVPEDRWLADLQQATEADGVRVIKHRIATGDASQFLLSTKPHVSPVELIRSVKGRLQHLIQGQVSRALQRNYCLRSIGSARRSVVEDYVAGQLGHHRMADPRAQQCLAGLQKRSPSVDLAKPCFSSHGEHWYNPHAVLVNDERRTEIREPVLAALSEMIDRVASKHGDRLSRVGLFADHVHMTMGCPIERSPEDVALAYLNNCAYAVGLKPVFRFGYYVGTIGEYDRGAV
jgi:REP element-mobilizing transposase RayT